MLLFSFYMFGVLNRKIFMRLKLHSYIVSTDKGILNSLFNIAAQNIFIGT